MKAFRFVPSAEQNDIIRAGRRSENFDIIAGAGCAKTTTLQMLAHDRLGVPGIYHAFNSSIVQDTIREQRFQGTRTVPLTMHQSAFRAVANDRGDFRAKVINTKTIMGHDAFIRANLPFFPDISEYRMAAMVDRTLAAFCNSDAREAGTEHAEAALVQTIGDPDMVRSELVANRIRERIETLAPRLAAITRDLFSSCVETGHLTYDIFLKMFEMDASLIRSAYRGMDRIFLDEAQDSSPVQTSILKKSGLQIVRVGDRKQAIYAWRGAIDALETPNGPVLPLSTSFRFPQEIANIAMEAASHSPLGGLGFDLVGAGTGQTTLKNDLRYACICRTNTGVLFTAERLAEKGKSFSVDRGSQVVSELESAIRMFDGDRRPGIGPLSPFSNWAEVVREAEEGNDGDIRRLVRLVEDGSKAKRLVRLLNEAGLAEKGTRSHHIITAHRSKGDEYPSVSVGLGWDNVDAMKTRYAEARSRAERITVAQEFNLLYVLATRAQVNIGGMGKILSPEPDLLPQLNG